METRQHEKTSPASRAVIRRIEAFQYSARDPDTMRALGSLRAGEAHASRWISICLRSDEFRSQIALTLSHMKNLGWSLVGIRAIDSTVDGLRADLVLEKPIG